MPLTAPPVSAAQGYLWVAGFSRGDLRRVNAMCFLGLRKNAQWAGASNRQAYFKA